MSNHINKLSRRFFISICTAALIVACSQTQVNQPQSGQKTDTGATQGGEVNIYSSRHYNTDEQLYDGFTEQTGIKVNLIEGKDDELIERIKSEGENSPADLLITVDAGRLWRGAEAGIFAPVESEVLTQNIPANLRDPNNLWLQATIKAAVQILIKKRRESLFM